MRMWMAMIPGHRLWLLLATLLALTGGLAGGARADEIVDEQGRAGRIAELSGQAWLYDPEERGWTPLARNQTIAEGDRLRSDAEARLHLRIGSSSIWLDGGSELDIEAMDDERVALRLQRGSLALLLRHPSQVDDYRLLTEEGRLIPESVGRYRIDQLGRGSRATTWAGRLRYEARGAAAEPVWLGAGEQGEFWFSQGEARAERQPLQHDEFDRWLQSQRDALDREPEAWRHVSPELTGAEELDRHGRWDRDEEYGTLWIPHQVSVGWAPFREGRWVWSLRWGWTWVDAMPWGFAPFHYGRWVMVRGRWCWAPGAHRQRPIYAPAAVAWGGSPGLSLGIHIGGKRPPPPRPGWRPLRPHEHYTPIYRPSPGWRPPRREEDRLLKVPRPDWRGEPRVERRDERVEGRRDEWRDARRDEGRDERRIDRREDRGRDRNDGRRDEGQREWRPGQGPQRPQPPLAPQAPQLAPAAPPSPGWNRAVGPQPMPQPPQQREAGQRGAQERSVEPPNGSVRLFRPDPPRETREPTRESNKDERRGRGEAQGRSQAQQ